ncbi:prepilin-type N-terminal cleavage/methylation domain-containing protein [Lentibacillus lipolyticus]|nr:prepilin-type N-terminal cleavage/methylation domain-containing protein [Lentibacillus lipolyticus]
MLKVMFPAVAMPSKNGFTLVEMLLVLSIWSVLILLTVPTQFQVLEHKTEKQFLNTLEMDLLYVQSLSYNSRAVYRLTFPDDHHYEIRKGFTPIVERKVPEGWNVQKRTLPEISFNHQGTIRDPGTFSIETTSSTYNIVCPFGKGRCYIDEQ